MNVFPPFFVALVAAALVPATANAGSAFLASWTVRNQGAGDSARTRWRDRVVLSRDNLFGNAERLRLEAQGTRLGGGNVENTGARVAVNFRDPFVFVRSPTSSGR